jgi:hypothetical protein
MVIRLSCHIQVIMYGDRGDARSSCKSLVSRIRYADSNGTSGGYFVCHAGDTILCRKPCTRAFLEPWSSANFFCMVVISEGRNLGQSPVSTYHWQYVYEPVAAAYTQHSLHIPESHGSTQVNSSFRVDPRIQVVIIISTYPVYLQLISVNLARMPVR